MGGEANQLLWRGIRQIEGVRGVWPARNSTRFHNNTGRSIAGVSLVYTVPTGKILFLSTIGCSSRLSAAANVFCYIYINDAGASTIVRPIVHNYTVAGQMAESKYYCPAIEAPAGGTVRLYNSAANLHIEGLFSGWIEDE